MCKPLNEVYLCICDITLIYVVTVLQSLPQRMKLFCVQQVGQNIHHTLLLLRQHSVDGMCPLDKKGCIS